MILTTHAIVGSAVANLFYSRPEIGLPLAYFSHYLLDTLPHINYEHQSFITKASGHAHADIHHAKGVMQIIFIILDLLMAFIFAVILFTFDKRSLILSVSGAVLGILPDVLNLMHHKFKNGILEKLSNLHDRTHFHDANNYNIVYGTLIQIGIVFLAIALYIVVAILVR